MTGQALTVQPYASLTPSGRLRRLAGRALEHYALETPRLRLLSAKEHAIFRVNARAPGQAVMERFALRLYLPAAYHEPSVITELEWLTALVRDAGLVVPEPIPTRTGEMLVLVDESDTDTRRPAALFRWVEGRRHKASLSRQDLAAVGRFTGRLHEHATHFMPSVGRAGQRWDWDRVFGPGSPVAPDSDDPRLTLEQRELFRDMAARLRQAMRELGTDPQVWGLIHADLHSSNYLFHDGDVHAIDFEDCGWGYYLYDLAVILDEIYAVFPLRALELRQGLLNGYRQIRTLPADHESLLDLFVAMRLAELLRWHATSDEAVYGLAVPQLLDEAVAHFQQRVLD